MKPEQEEKEMRECPEPVPFAVDRRETEWGGVHIEEPFAVYINRVLARTQREEEMGGRAARVSG
jgi:hypothetical protein